MKESTQSPAIMPNREQIKAIYAMAKNTELGADHVFVPKDFILKMGLTEDNLLQLLPGVFDGSTRNTFEFMKSGLMKLLGIGGRGK